jgi:sugar-specific transcriptional regulator TrmB
MEELPKKPIKFETVPIEVSIDQLKREIELLKKTIENYGVNTGSGFALPENKEFYESKLLRLEKELEDTLGSSK